ncbi:MAG: putative porin [Sphingomonadaceae bacterium]
MSSPSRWKFSATVASLLFATALAGVPTLGAAQEAAPAAPATSESAMANLVRMLVEQKVLTPQKGAELMAQAEAEATRARSAQPAMPAAAPGTVRVPYIPESVRAQIRDELKQEVLGQAQREGWAAPGDASPDWVKRITLSGDVRIRSQSNLYSRNNSNQVPDFARINAVGPIPITGGSFIPLFNTQVDRASRLFVRARLGIDARLSDWLEGGIAIATGSDNSPISTNQNLGGGLAKRDLWLDKAFIRARPTAWSEFSAGRFTNPFFSTPLLFDEDLRFDGAAAKLSSAGMIGDDVTVSVRGGAFPLDFSDPNYPQNNFTKRDVRERWLFSGQLELAAKLGDDVSVRIAGAYHDFRNLRANLSEPCFLYQTQSEFRSGVICSTDNERATFLRKGNTVFPIRDIVIDVPALAPGETRTQPQFVGLAFNYRVLNVNGQVKYKFSDTQSATLTGDYVRNLGFNQSSLCRYGPDFSAAYPPQNNVFDPVPGFDPIRGNLCAPGSTTVFTGGREGYYASLLVGHDKLFTRGHWNAMLSYRSLDTDAVPDAYTDSNFHLGGTNAKGFTVEAKGSLVDGMNIGVRWLSANEVSGEPFRIDVLQADLEIAF